MRITPSEAGLRSERLLSRSRNRRRRGCRADHRHGAADRKRRGAALMSKAKVAPVTFLASIPDIKSAILVGSDGLQLKLEVPESEMGNAVFLVGMRGKILKVTIEVQAE